MAGKIIIDTERCKGCALCVPVCPKNCIVISKHSNKTGYFPVQANNINCTGCAACAIICPEAIIEVHLDGKIMAIGPASKKEPKLTREKV